MIYPEAVGGVYVGVLFIKSTRTGLPGTFRWKLAASSGREESHIGSVTAGLHMLRLMYFNVFLLSLYLRFCLPSASYWYLGSNIGIAEAA